MDNITFVQIPLGIDQIYFDYIVSDFGLFKFRTEGHRFALVSMCAYSNLMGPLFTFLFWFSTFETPVYSMSILKIVFPMKLFTHLYCGLQWNKFRLVVK